MKAIKAIATAAALCAANNAAALDTLVIDSHTRITVYTGHIIYLQSDSTSGQIVLNDISEWFYMTRDSIMANGFEIPLPSDPPLAWRWVPYFGNGSPEYTSMCTSYLYGSPGSQGVTLSCPGVDP